MIGPNSLTRFECHSTYAIVERSFVSDMVTLLITDDFFRVATDPSLTMHMELLEEFFYQQK